MDDKGQNKHSETLNVVFVLYENALSTSISLPIELLKSADHMARARCKNSRAPTPPALEIKTASIDGRAITTQTGIIIPADEKLENISKADIVFLPAMWRNPVPVVNNNQALSLWISTMFSRETSAIAGVGTGCYFLADAGLLDNCVATTHWYFFEQFEKRYPKVKLQRNYFITQSGKIYCTGSVNTLADLTVHFIEQYYDEKISAEVERHFFHDIRRNYQKLVLSEDEHKLHHDEAITYAQSYLRSHIDKTLNIDEIAEKTGMSRRNFDRRFKNTIGVSPLMYIQKLRIEMAQDLLKNSNLDISEIMLQVGYQDITYFSRLFKKFNGATPRQYRMTVRAKLFSLET